MYINMHVRVNGSSTLEQMDPTASAYGESSGLEWRYSFSQAELLLADALPSPARTAFLAFKAVVKCKVDKYGKRLSSYILKNIMLRKVEQLENVFWSDESASEDFFMYDVSKAISLNA